MTIFNVGNINLSLFDNEVYIPQGVERPHEFFADLAYTLLLSEKFALSVTTRYLRSELTLRSHNQRNTAFSFASDISGFYASDQIPYSNFYGKLRLGFQISNIGTKIKYTDLGREFFLPTTLKLGGGYDFIFDNEDVVSLSLEVKKLLVPTPPQYGFIDQNNNAVQDSDEPTIIVAGKDDNVSFLAGMFQSFYDAPNGFGEELQEIQWSVGTSYAFNNSFSVRLGYFNENPTKGARQFFTLGTGFSASKCNINVAYLFSLSKIPNPLEKGPRVSIDF